MARHSALVFAAMAGTAAASTAGTLPLTGALTDTGCFAPKSAGSWGYCGPASCKKTYITCPAEGGGPATVGGETGSYVSQGGKQITEATCHSFMPRTSNADATDFSPRGPCSSTCTQQKTGVCSATFLANVLKGNGVKRAYCNDKWLVIVSDGSPGVFEANLDDIPFPPGAGTNQRSGMASLDKSRLDTLFYPLSVVDLATSTGENNIDVWDSATYMLHKSGAKYGLPADGGIGMGVNGQSIFPIYNNNAQYTPSKCEVDSCQEHVGQGGGQPHWHGDPFSADEATYRCLYGPGNYSSTAAHPPVIGFAGDGHLIYGRYLSSKAPGFAAPLLDACGGHVHDESTDVDEHGLNLHDNYHYHTQVFDATCETGDMCTSGETYKASSTGPLQCFKADLSKQEGGSALLSATSSASYKTKNDMGYACCGLTDYYAITGFTFPSGYVDDSASCAVPAAPANGQWAAGTACAGTAKLLSGYQCTPTCDTGYCPSGTTRCVKGAIVESATCVAKANAADVCDYQLSSGSDSADGGDGSGDAADGSGDGSDAADGSGDAADGSGDADGGKNTSSTISGGPTRAAAGLAMALSAAAMVSVA